MARAGAGRYLVRMPGPSPSNEPVQDFAKGSPERAALRDELARQSATCLEVPLVIGGQQRRPGDPLPFSAPHRHDLVIGRRYEADAAATDAAIEASLSAKAGWAARSFDERAAVFLRAAELLSGPWRQRMLAATMLNQSKTVYQAEIDAVAELCDFFRFNVYFAERLQAEPLISPPGVSNRWDFRPLDGFVYAVSPFNFTSIAGNLPTAPALLGNTVVWKPSPLAALSAFVIQELLREAGLPDGVINLVQGDAAAISEQVLTHADFSGLHFTGSTAVLRGLCARIGTELPRYRSYPRVVGESGGKDFVLAHPSAELESLTVALVRGAFEYQGQKCSAASRAYVPRSLWPELRQRLVDMIAEIKIGDPADLSCFMGAVIGRAAYERIRRYQTLAQSDARCTILAGGGASDVSGFFVEPTLVETQDPAHALMREEIFGPLLCVWVYDDLEYERVLELCEQTSGYALTGAVFARDDSALSLALTRLRFAAGNFYVNDKPTGAVVGQQPFGGARLSGTNDKAGSAWNLMRWVSPRVIKENFAPPRDFRYPHMVEGD
jgi:1-pyrroline-5-carboxylate dehydrogenase